MPGLGGRQVLERIRGGARPRTPVGILSGYVGKLGLAEELGDADAVLPKGPGELDDLMRRFGKAHKTPCTASERATRRQRS